jgi:integrase
MELTDRKIASIKPALTRQEIKDGKWPVFLVVQPTGTKSFQWRGRIGGKPARRALGTYPAMSLADARSAALALKNDVKAGKVTPRAPAAPVAAPSPIPVVEQGLTVSQAFARYMHHEGNALPTAGERWRMFEKDIEPHIGTKLLASVHRTHLTKIISDKFKTARIQSNRTQMVLSRFFNWCMEEGWEETRLDASPMQHVKKLAKEQPREWWLSEQEIGWFFKALPAARSFAPIFEMLAYTVTRRSDMFDLEWNMVQEDRIDLPETKNGMAHVVWLHPSVRAIMPQRPAAAKPTDCVFSVEKSGYSKPVRDLRLRMQETTATRTTPPTSSSTTSAGPPRRSWRASLTRTTTSAFRPTSATSCSRTRTAPCAVASTTVTTAMPRRRLL